MSHPAPHSATSPRLLWLLVVALACAACSGSTEEAPALPPPDERVRDIDLPLSRRANDRAGDDAVPVLIAIDAIAIGGTEVATLTRGALTPAPRAPTPVAALTAAVPAGKTEARIRMHQATHLATLLTVVASLREKGIERFAFDVRRDALASATGAFVVERLEARAPSTEPHRFDPPYARAWDTVTEVWDDAYVACSTSEGSFDCSPVPPQIAFGGDVDIAIFRRQNGVILDFRRFGMGNDVTAREAFLAQQNTRTEGTRNRDADREAIPPATLASFGFRWASLSADPEAPIAKVMRELTRNEPVGVRVSADPTSEAGAIVTLLGAAFPEGVRAPAVVLDAQPR